LFDFYFVCLNSNLLLTFKSTAGGPQSDYAFISFQRHRGNVTIVGIDVLSHCKEPSKQFALVEEHIAALRKNLYRTHSKVTIFTERNLGFEVYCYTNLSLFSCLH
jgi:hypothetical protein